MRILIVDTMYPSFVAHHYAMSPGLEDRPYDEQWRSLMSTFFGTADAYSHFLGELGHDAHELVVNCDPLQRAWAREHRLRPRILPPLRRSRPQAWLVERQAAAYEPDVVYVQDLAALPDATLERLRKTARLLVGQLGTNPPPLERLRRFDLVCTSFPHYVERLRDAGIATEYLGIAFDPRVLDRIGDEERASDGAVFVGTLARNQWQVSNVTLERAARRAPIELWGLRVDDWPEDSPFRTRWRGEAWGIDMYRVLARSRIAVNRHGDVAEDNANNMRLYEATGVGTLLLTDRKQNLGELFAVGREVEDYETEDELVEKIAHYLSHEDERAAVAAAGQQRTLSDHTYRQRMAELAGILARYLT